MTYLVTYRRSMRVLTLVGIALFCTALENLLLAVFAVAAAAVAWLLTEGPAGRPLPRWAINSGLILATVSVLLPVFTRPDVDPVASVGTLLVWLSVVKLYEPRTPRDQMQIIVISLMLVVAACLTNVTVQVGGLLLLYLPVLIFTVALYQVYIGHENAQRHAALTMGQRGEAAAPQAQWTRRAPRDLRRIMLMGLTGIGAGTFLVFVLMPRGVGENLLGRWEEPVAGSVTGFKDHVQLGGQGLLTQSLAVVMEVKATIGGRPYGSGSTPLRLRGAVLDQYDPVLAVWARSERAHDRMLPTEAENLPHSNVIRLEFSVRAPTSMLFFSIWRPLRLQYEGEEFKSRRENGVLRTGRRRLPSSYTVECATQFQYPAEQFNAGEPLDFPVPGVEAIARRAIERAQLVPEQVYERNGDFAQIVEVLNAWLSDPRNFTYSTEMVAPRAGEDPILMFLERTKKGHCEYFASALAGMCRSVGINARVVTGFLADEYDDSRHTYIVRESNAHAWVEAEISPGLWRTYDPSPIAGLQAAQEARTVGDRIRRVLEAVEFAWITSVVGFSADDQRGRAPGQPSLLARLDEFAWVSGFVSSRQPGQPAGSQFLAMLTNIVTVAAAGGLGGYIVVLLARTLAHRWPRRARDAGQTEPDAAVLAARARFYARMIRLLRRGGAAKPAWRPPHWHASHLDSRDPQMAEGVRALTDAYYQLRYARRDLTQQQQASVAAAMRSLEQWAARARKAR